MAAKVLLGVIGSAICLWFWWTVPLKSLRAGEEDALRAENAVLQAQQTAATKPEIQGAEFTEGDTPWERTQNRARQVLDEYDAMLEWVGDPFSKTSEAEFIDVCAKMRIRLNGLLHGLNEDELRELLEDESGEPLEDRIDKYSCDLRPPVEGVGGARILPLTLEISSSAMGDEDPAEKAEAMILDVEEIPQLLLESFSVAEDPSGLVDGDGNLISPKAYIKLTLKYYVLAEPRREDYLAFKRRECPDDVDITPDDVEAPVEACPDDADRQTLYEEVREVRTQGERQGQSSR